MRYNVKIKEVCEYELKGIEASNEDEAEEIATDLYGSTSPEEMYIDNIEIKEVKSPASSGKIGEGILTYGNKYVCCWPFIGGTNTRLKFMQGDIVLALGGTKEYQIVKFNGTEYEIANSELCFFAPVNDLSEVE